MRIVTKTLSDADFEKNDYRNEYEIHVDGKREIRANDYGQPEDNSLGRDLNFVYGVVPLMKRAYEAGKAGEPLEITEEELTLDI